MPETALSRLLAPLAVAVLSAAVAGCGNSTRVFGGTPTVGLQAKTPAAAEKLGFPLVATKNTTRVAGGDPVVDAAAVALAVYPSAIQGTHPPAVALVPDTSWQAGVAASSLMAPPFRIPLLVSGRGSVPSATADAFGQLAPTGGSRLPPGTTVVDIAGAAAPAGAAGRTATVGAAADDPAAIAAAIDRFESAARGRTTKAVMVASADDPAYAMPAAGLAAESGAPILYVTGGGVPETTKRALLARPGARIYVIGPPSVIGSGVTGELRRYGAVHRIGAEGAAANSVALAVYRDPPCPSGQPCAHVAGSFGWALRGPGHGYTLVSTRRPLDAAAAAALSSSGSYGPILLVDQPASLPTPVLNYLLDYAATGYDQSGPTAASYNHGWVVGDPGAVSSAVQAQLDSLLEPTQVGK